jgi:hypothetical protein
MLQKEGLNTPHPAAPDKDATTTAAIRDYAIERFERPSAAFGRMRFTSMTKAVDMGHLQEVGRAERRQPSMPERIRTGAGVRNPFPPSAGRRAAT